MHKTTTDLNMLLRASGGLAQPTAIAVVRGGPSECGECAEVLAALDHARTDMALHYSAIEAAYVNSKKFPNVAEQLIRAAKREEQEAQGKKEGGGNNAMPMMRGELAQVFIVYAWCLGGCVHARMSACVRREDHRIELVGFHSLALSCRVWVCALVVPPRGFFNVQVSECFAGRTSCSRV